MKSEERSRAVGVDVVSCYLVVCFLLSVARATSNVHSVWLEASTRPPPKSDPTGNSQRVFSQRTGLWSVSPQDALANSASSLQPAIVDQDSAGVNSNRRSDSDQTISYANDTNATDLATTSDWPNHRGANNGHVHFDEEAVQKSSLRSSLQVTNSLGEQDELTPTELYNSTNYITPTSQSSAVGFEDFASENPATIAQAVSNSSSLPSYEIGHKNRTNSNAAEQPALIYYLTDGDRWNHQRHQQQHSQQLEDSPNQPTSHSTFQSSPSRDSPGDLNSVDRRWRPNQAPVATSNPRRKLHNSGTQYDLREFHHQPLLPNSAELELAQRRQQTNELRQQQQQQQQYQPEQNLIQFIDQLAPNPRLLDPRPNQATTPLPATQIGRQVVHQRQPGPVRAPFSFVQSPLDGPLLVQHPQHHQPSHYHLRQPQTTNNRRPPQQQNKSPPWRQRSSPSSNRNSWLDPQPAQRSFLQNYVPSIGRPKLKPTSMLSGWMSPTSGGGSRQLENAFYSTSEQRPWKAANYHYNYEQPLSGQHSQAGRLYTLLNQPGGNKPASYQRPTMAPAANFVQHRRPQRDMTQPNQMGAGQRPGAGFIPVVAVSVTKTSPVPMPAAHSNQLTDVSIEQPHAEMEPTGEYHHQLAPAPRVRRTQQQQAKVHFDDYGNYASGSSGDPATLVGNQQRISYQPATETTTVKSALFGYLPHEAEQPLLGAMNLFTPIQQHVASDSNRATSLYQHQSQRFGMDQQHMGEGGHLQAFEEPPTPLGLQLQANSYVQNDIAHPFGSNSIDSAADQRAPLFYLDGASSSSSHQFAKHDLPIVQSHQGLMSALLADGSLRSPHLIAAASEISPMVPVVFASPQQSVSTNQGQDEAAESSADQDRHQYRVGPTRAGSTLSTKANKKRSGDFFASAGQLLLSALPLLLAPTLGLMFASTPTAVARYQGQNPFGDTNGLQAGAVPSSYMGGLNQGIVSNASPAPLLFTPSPLSKLGNASTEFPPKATPTTAPPLPTTSNFTTTSAPRGNAHQIKQHRPTLGPVQTLASWTGSTPPPPPPRNYSIILTTLAPQPFSSTSSALNSNSRTNLVDEASNGTNFEHHATHTILLIKSDLDGQNSSEPHRTDSASDEKVKSHYDIGGYEGVDFDAQFPSLTKTSTTFMAGHKKPDAIRQDTTDVQKEKGNDKNRYHYSQTFDSYPSSEDNSMKHSHIYKPAPTSKNINKTISSANYDDDDDDDDSEDNLKLFPVSRWPTMHRRTVSLVTSNGNKTMPDSSDKYSADLADVGKGSQKRENEKSPLANKSLYPTMQQVQRGRIKRSLNSTTTSNEVMSLTNITLKGGKKLVKVVKRRKIKRPKEQSALMVGNNSSTNGDPMLSESSSGRVRIEQDSIGKRGDHKSDSTKHIIATMVAQMNDPDEAADNDGDQQLREHLLRKKIMLDRLATSSMYTSPQETKRHEFVGSSMGRRGHRVELEEEDDLANENNLSSGGRGRLPSLPLEIVSSKTKPRRVSEKKVSDNLDEEEEANLVLTDDTRKALTKLGNLLIKDTLQIPYSGKANGQDSISMRSRKGSNSKSRKSGGQHQIDEKEEDTDEPVATERSFARTTPYPPELRSQQYRQEPNNSYIGPFHHDNQSYSYTGTQRYQSSFPPIRDQVSLIPNDHIGGGYGPPDEGRFGSREDRRNIYGAPIVASRYAQPDRYNRSDPYSNYASAREPPPPSSGYGSYYSRPVGRDPPPSRSHYDSRGHNYPPSGYPHNGSAYPPPNHRPSDDYYDSSRDSYSPPPAYPGPDDHQHYNNNNKYPADPRYPAASHEYESWPPRASSQDQRDYQPGYSRSVPSYPPPPPLERDRDREPAYTSPPPTQQVGPPLGRTLAGDSSAVNEYLKRVQFSDSDRDKLMASYLTCDGLLNDNDHCLERLSCEFSDLKNIAQANKLDRAVSSILLGHILINTYIPLTFKQRLKTASIFGYTNSGGCSKYVCNKLTKSTGANNNNNSGGGPV